MHIELCCAVLQVREVSHVPLPPVGSARGGVVSRGEGQASWGYHERAAGPAERFLRFGLIFYFTFTLVKLILECTCSDCLI